MAAAFFDQCLQDRLELQRVRRRSNRRLTALHAVVEQLENTAMERLDVDANDEHRVDRTDSKLRFHHLRQAMGGGSWLGDKVTPRLTSDSTLRAHVERSTLSGTLQDTRTFFEKHSHDLMHVIDDARRELKYIFDDYSSPNRILANPKGDFENALRKMWIHAETKIVDMFKGLDGRLLSVAKATQPIAKAACRTMGCQTIQADCECSASKTMQIQQQKLSDLGVAFANMKAANAQLDRELKATQQSLTSTVEALASTQHAGYKALSAFHKHRFRWCSSVPDASRGVNVSDRSPSGIVCLLEAGNSHKSLLEQFHKWVLSDEQGGACFTKATTAVTPRVKESDHVFRPFDENPTARMDDWAAKQSEMWGRRRASLVTAPVNVRLDTNNTPDAFTPRVPITSSGSFRRRHSSAF